jgi:hypothetical protein
MNRSSYHAALLRMEGRPEITRAYEKLVQKMREVAGVYMKDAWSTPAHHERRGDEHEGVVRLLAAEGLCRSPARPGSSAARASRSRTAPGPPSLRASRQLGLANPPAFKTIPSSVEESTRRGHDQPSLRTTVRNPTTPRYRIVQSKSSLQDARTTLASKLRVCIGRGGWRGETPLCRPGRHERRSRLQHEARGTRALGYANAPHLPGTSTDGVEQPGAARNLLSRQCASGDQCTEAPARR